MGNGNSRHQGVQRLEQLGKTSLDTLKPLTQLQLARQAFEVAERELISALGVPICIPNCGKCCENTAVCVWEVEAHYALSYLLGSGPNLETILSACEHWLLERNPNLKTYGLNGVLSQEQWDKLRPEVNLLLLHSQCPMLTIDKRCLVHDIRPLTCMAYGTSHLTDRACPRPLSSIESDEVRGHVPITGLSGQKMRRMVDKTLRSAAQVGWTGTRFLATAIFMLAKPAKFNEYVQDGKIASAKTIQMPLSPSILFQEDLEKVWIKQPVNTLK